MATETKFRSTSHGFETVIHRRDCVAGMQELLEPESVDVVVTSPPYNLGIAYRSYDDTVPRTEYLDWIAAWGDAVHRVLTRSGSLFLNIGGKPSDPWSPFDVLSRLRQRFVLPNTIHWIKSIAIDADCRRDRRHASRRTSPSATTSRINSQRYVNDCHEYIFHLTRFGDVELDRRAIGVEYQDKSNVGRWAAATNDRRCRGNTWFVPYRTIKSRDCERPHPATFPVRIPMLCTRLHGLERVKRVMDLFLGLGHIALACKTLGVPGVGFETDEDYFAESRRLIASFNPADAVDTHPTGSRPASAVLTRRFRHRRDRLQPEQVHAAAWTAPGRQPRDRDPRTQARSTTGTASPTYVQVDCLDVGPAVPALFHLTNVRPRLRNVDAGASPPAVRRTPGNASSSTPIRSGRASRATCAAP